MNLSLANLTLLWLGKWNEDPDLAVREGNKLSLWGYSGHVLVNLSWLDLGLNNLGAFLVLVRGVLSGDLLFLNNCYFLLHISHSALLAAENYCENGHEENWNQEEEEGEYSRVVVGVLDAFVFGTVVNVIVR